jgi:hypothetical protein
MRGMCHSKNVKTFKRANMKKTMMMALMCMAAVSCMAQGRRHVMNMNAVQLTGRYVVADTGSQLTVIPHMEADTSVKFVYVLADSAGGVVKRGSYKCKGNCYTYFKANLSPVISYKIVEDSVLGGVR